MLYVFQYWVLYMTHKVCPILKLSKDSQGTQNSPWRFTVSLVRVLCVVSWTCFRTLFKQSRNHIWSIAQRLWRNFQFQELPCDHGWWENYTVPLLGERLNPWSTLYRYLDYTYFTFACLSPSYFELIAKYCRSPNKNFCHLIPEYLRLQFVEYMLTDYTILYLYLNSEQNVQ
jgi:hypothetical protein